MTIRKFINLVEGMAGADVIRQQVDEAITSVLEFRNRLDLKSDSEIMRILHMVYLQGVTDGHQAHPKSPVMDQSRASDAKWP